MLILRYILFLMVIVVSTQACAGLSIQLFGGTADTQNTTVNVDYVYYDPPSRESVPVNGDSGLYGIRFLMTEIFESSFNVGIELSSYEASSDTVNIDIWPLSWQLIYAFKGHSFEPYIGIGILVTYSYLDVPDDFGSGYDVGGTTFSDGMELLIGVSYPLNKKYSLFAEYRQRQNNVESETTAFIPLGAVTTRTTAELDTNLLLIGVSFDY